jgi:phosphopantothenoylcysteine decarboxylase/phosphopantothenate--cysteine ligase
MSDRILLGITSSAAAFKGVALASLLRQRGFIVDGILSANACRLITPAQLSCATGRPVFTNLFQTQPANAIPHITLSEDAAALVVAPATAHFLARLAWGLADELITCTALACDCPMLVAPAMNPRMWSNPATVENVAKLSSRGVLFVGPEEGAVACGTVGRGRMTEPEAILAAVLEMLGRKRA